MTRRLIVLSVCAALLFACSACGVVLDITGEIADSAAKGRSGTPTDAAVTLAPSPTPELTPEPTPQPVSDADKFNAYVSASDVLSDRIELCLAGYATRVCALDSAYTVDKRTFDGWINSIGASERERLQASLEYAAQAPAMEPVDSVYLALGPVALEVVDTLSQIYAYYDAKGYADDGFAKGEALHDTLAARVDAYTALSQAFVAALSDMSHERVLASLDMFKQDGRLLLYHSNVFILEAEALCALLADTEQSSKGELTIGAEAYRAVYDRLAAAHADFSSAAASGQASAEGLRTTIDSFKRAVDSFTSEAAQIAQTLDNGGTATAADAQTLMDQYGDIVDEYNRLI